MKKGKTAPDEIVLFFVFCLEKLCANFFMFCFRKKNSKKNSNNAQGIVLSLCSSFVVVFVKQWFTLTTLCLTFGISFFFLLAYRYGRVQSVKILLSSAFHPNLLLPKSPHYGHIKDQQINDNLDVSSLLPSGGGVTIPSVNCGSSVSSNSSSNSSTTSNNNNNNNNNSSNNNTISSNITSNSTNNMAMCTTTTLANYNAGSVCATVAFIDIKSASKAHTAENKFDDRLLTTEYYEPSSIPSTSGENSPSSNCSSGTQSSQHLSLSSQQLMKNANAKQPSISANINDKSVSLPVQQYSSVATPQTAVAAVVLSSQLSTVTVPTRFPTPNHG